MLRIAHRSALPSASGVGTLLISLRGSWFKILTHQSRRPEDPSTTSPEFSQQVAMSAADRILRTVEGLLSLDRVRHCPIHITPVLFATISMPAIDIRSSDIVREKLGYVKIRLSMIALRELQSTWPVSRWIHLLLTKIVLQIRDQDDLNAQEGSEEGSSHTGKTRAKTEASKGVV